MIRGFFAYQAYPDSVAEIIERTIDELNGSDVVNIKGWKVSEINGQYIIDTLIHDINNAELFACDLTALNPNVLFELGYAIAREKRRWITLNPTIKGSEQNYSRFILSTLGYSPYATVSDLRTKFYEDRVWEREADSLLFSTEYVQKRNLVYLRSSVRTEASSRLSAAVMDSGLPVVKDNPQETTIQPLSWYIQESINALGVVIELIGENRESTPHFNAKQALLSGIAHGLGVPLLMVVEEPYHSPIDFRDMLKHYRTSDECVAIFDEWIKPIRIEYNSSKSSYLTHVRAKHFMNELRNLFVGEHIAENESDTLPNYFFPTQAYSEALNSQQSLFVGRKGTGKTANFIALRHNLSSDRRNFVCSIQPESYDVEGVLSVVKDMGEHSEKSYFTESVWKYLIYTEIAKSAFEMVREKNPGVRTSSEIEFMEYVTDNAESITLDFTLRVEHVLHRLMESAETSSLTEQRTRISELLHTSMIVKLREYLGEVLHEKEKVYVLIDNLDSSWNHSGELKDISELLLSLLRVIDRVTHDFRSAGFRRKPVSLSIVTFLRSDILMKLSALATERDKITFSHVSWDDPEVLFHLIEERFSFRADSIPSPRELWSTFFCESIREIPFREYISNLIICRPRDIILLFKECINEALSRGHVKVEEEDFLRAELKYSKFAHDSLLAERGDIAQMEEILYEFVGSSPIVTEDDIRTAIIACGIHREEKVQEVINLLFDLAFLGFETSHRTFEFVTDIRNRNVLSRLARRFAKALEQKPRYAIHRAYHSFLGIEYDGI